jgi:Concanavalin A-like lectin/glucanases superfamily
VARAFVAASTQQLFNASTPVSGVPLSMACWFRTTTGAWKGLIDLANSAGGGTGEVGLGLTATGTGIGANRVVAEINGGTGGTSAVSTISHSQANVWEHAAAVFGSNTSRAAYLNGGNKGTATLSATPAGLNELFIGNDIFNDYHDGAIADAAIWAAALDDYEIAALALGVSPLLIRPSALVAYWPLVGVTSPEIDLIGRRELTVTGATIAPQPRLILPIGQVVGRFGSHTFLLTGQTKNSSGAALGGCTVRLFRTSDNLLIATTTSDGSGNYSFTVGDGTTAYYAVAYLAGSPDVAGTTVNTLVGV